MPDLVELISTIVRPGLWCDGCMSSNRLEADVYSGGEVGVGVVATLEGCRTCRTGICAASEASDER